MTNGDVVQVPDLTNWMESHQILSGIPIEKVAATFTKAPNGGWGGKAVVPGLRCEQTLYTAAKGDDLDAIEAMISGLAAHARQVMAWQDKTVRLEALLASHDWYAAYSDDYGVCQAADRDLNTIMALMKEIDAETAQALFAKYAPQRLREGSIA